MTGFQPLGVYPVGVSRLGAVRFRASGVGACPTRVITRSEDETNVGGVYALSVFAVLVESGDACERRVTRNAMRRIKASPSPATPATVGIGRIEVVHDGTSQNVANPHSITAGVCVIGLERPVLLCVFRCGGLAGLR